MTDSVSCLNTGKDTAVSGKLLILGEMDESRMGSWHSCSTHCRFTVHLQVFGIISGVVIVIVLYSRSFLTICYYKNENPLGRTSLMRLCFFDEEITVMSCAVLPALKD